MEREVVWGAVLVTCTLGFLAGAWAWALGWM